MLATSMAMRHRNCKEHTDGSLWFEVNLFFFFLPSHSECVALLTGGGPHSLVILSTGTAKGNLHAQATPHPILIGAAVPWSMFIALRVAWNARRPRPDMA